MVLKFMAAFIQSIMGPRLYRIYHRANAEGQLYTPNWAEGLGDFAVTYAVPSVAIYCVWQRRVQYFIYLGVIIIGAYTLRAVGRSCNPSYISFLQILKRAQTVFNTENAELLRRYDFEFKHWPISYKSTRVSQYVSLSEQRGNVGGITGFLGYYVGWLVAHTFGIRLIYPGLLFSSLLRTPMEEARAKYIMERNGVRTRVAAADGNTLDTMFFDRRRMMTFVNFKQINETNPSGKTLVICFEGNAGFYEIGMMATPLDAGYSILGWNHPGFGGSTGVPYPSAELNAAEAVFDYAVTELGFKEEEIVLYAWSIGGYPAAYIAANHPKVKALILDATFDDILPLAIPRMPSFLAGIVRSTIRNHVDLHVSKEVTAYNGPVRLYRRTEDEIIADPPAVLSENRGNFLLTDIIRKRFPQLLNNPTSEKRLRDWLAKPHVVEPNAGAVYLQNSALVIPDNADNLTDADKARLVLEIADRLLTDFKSTHCIPLPPAMFKLPWIGPTRNAAGDQLQSAAHSQ